MVKEKNASKSVLRWVVLTVIFATLALGAVSTELDEERVMDEFSESHGVARV